MTKESQSPLIGAFVPGTFNHEVNVIDIASQSPLIGAFVPGRENRLTLESDSRVSIPSDRGIRSG